MENQSCGDDKVAGATFTISPMSEHFIDIILNALKKADTSKVWMETDDVTTTVRGKTSHVFDVTKAIFLHAATTGEHVAYQATYTIGCPSNATENSYMAVDDQLMNKNDVKLLKQPIAAKFSLYPLAGGNFMNIIVEQIEEMKKHARVTPAHYSTRIDGEAVPIFEGLESALSATAEAGSSHTIMTVSISANSPSHKNN